VQVSESFILGNPFYWLNAECYLLAAEMLCVRYHTTTTPPQVHDPKEFSSNSSMTSVTLQGWFRGVVFARNA